MRDEHLPASDLLLKAAERVGAANPADTAAVLGAAWHGFCAAGAAGELLARHANPDEYPSLWVNARPVLTAAIDTLRTAPSVPRGLPAEVALDDTPAAWLDDADAAQIRRLILDLALALNISLYAAGEHAPGAADRKACQDATMLSSKLSECYEGRLRTFIKQPTPPRGRRRDANSGS